jgi:glycosyltransferase involved in cell wall biosynthesis
VINLGVDGRYQPLNDLRTAQTVRARHGITRPVILYNGSKKPHKNVLSLIEAYFKLRNERKLSCQLVIVGKRDNSSRETNYRAIERKITGTESGDDVIFTGQTSDQELAELYGTANVFVFPSLYEGFGLPPLEAMACGCPVVASRTSSLPEVCGDAARYIDPNDIESICDGISDVLSDQELAHDLSEKGLRQAKQFSWERCAHETLAVYNEVIDETRYRS